MRATALLEAPLNWMRSLGIGGAVAAPAPLGATVTAPSYRHAEIFTSETTGEWIQVACDCRLGFDHWHVPS